MSQIGVYLIIQRIVYKEEASYPVSAWPKHKKILTLEEKKTVTNEVSAI